MARISTVKAPHIVLNTPAGSEVKTIYVTHNQRGRAGLPVQDDRYEIEMKSQRAEEARLKTQLRKIEKDVERLGFLDAIIGVLLRFSAAEAYVLAL